MLIAFAPNKGDDVRGKARTPSQQVGDLPLIFFKIRASRDKATRRSWQRRARLALASLDGLTPAERHEIMCVWSRPDVCRIDGTSERCFGGN